MASVSRERAQQPYVELETADKMMSEPPPYASQNETRNFYPASAIPRIERNFSAQQEPSYIGQSTAHVSCITVAPGTDSRDQLIGSENQNVVILQQRESFAKKVALACCVTWWFCCPIGLAGFILAMKADGKAMYTDGTSIAKAHRLGIHSKRTSIAGIIIGVIIIIIYVILRIQGYVNSTTSECTCP